MKIVFVTSSYFPYFSAVGKCVYNLVQEIENNHEVYVISNMSRESISFTDKLSKHNIIRIRTKKMQKRDKLLKEKNSLLKKTKLFFFRSESYLSMIISKFSIQNELINLYVEELEKIGDIDMVIPTCYPFEAACAALEFKNKYNSLVKIRPILFDKFCESPTLHRNNINKKIKYNNNLNLEKCLVENSDKVFYVDSWLEHIKLISSENSNKLIHIEHPLLVNFRNDIVKPEQNRENGIISVIYTGVIDRKVRPPFFVLDFISRLVSYDDRFHFHFYTKGNCDSVIKKYEKKWPENIIFHGFVDSETALQKIDESNILLSIGNTDTSLIPSKIYEYMSFGKPIIHFYNCENDRIITLINEYSLGLSISQKKINSKDIMDFIEFCTTNKNISISFDAVKNKLLNATPSYISEKLLDI